MVKKEDIINFVSSWKNGILNIGNIYKKGGDYKKEADLFLKRHYLFDIEDVCLPHLGGRDGFRCGMAHAAYTGSAR